MSDTEVLSTGLTVGTEITVQNQLVSGINTRRLVLLRVPPLPPLPYPQQW